MSIAIAAKREVARRASQALAIVSAILLLLTASGMVLGWSATSAGAATAGEASIVPAAGGSATEMALTPPLGAACTGDSAGAGYALQSYLVPSSVDPDTLTFDAQGPMPLGQGVDFRQPLISATSSEPYIAEQTDIAASPGGPGTISGVPTFTLSFFNATILPPGTYNLGLACTLGNADDDQLDRYWNAQITVAADGADVPGGFTWTVVEGSGTTTTTDGDGSTTTSTDGDGSTTTSTDGDGSTTSSTAGDGSNTSIGGDSSTTGPAVVSNSGTPSGASFVSPSGILPYTGGSPWNLVLWAVLLLVFGRMAMLLGRKPRVRDET